MTDSIRLRVLGLLAGVALIAGCASDGETMAAAQEHRTMDPQQVGVLSSGASSGQALVAEINGYPAPKYVLQFKDELGITADQRFELTRLHSMTQGKARAMGDRLMQAEKQLDMFMANDQPKAADVRARIDEIGAIIAALRSLHIESYMKTRKLLTESQLKRYSELRGIPENPYAEKPAETPEEDPAAQTPLY